MKKGFSGELYINLKKTIAPKKEETNETKANVNNDGVLTAWRIPAYQPHRLVS